MTPPANYRQRLDAIRKRTSQARGRRTELNKALKLAREVGDHDAELLAEDRLRQVDTDIEHATSLENVLLNQLTGGSGSGMAESVFDDPETVQRLDRLANSTMPVGTMDLGPLMSAAETVAMIESGSWGSRPMAAAGVPPDVNLDDSSRLGPYFGVIPQLRRKLRLLDLIPTQVMEGHSFTFTREVGGLDSAFETAEGAMKPAADLGLTDATVVAQTIAHWLRLKRQQLADTPSLALTAQTRLTYGVMRRCERQIISGDGTGGTLTGVLATSGIASVAFDAAQPLSDLALDGITDVLLAEAEPNAVVLNPQDRATMLKLRATGSGTRLDSDGAYATPADTLWGLPVITSTVMPVGQALVGDWNLGTTLFVREGTNLRISDSDQDAFVKNEVVFLAEGRFGLAVWQPACFALVHFA